MFILFRINKNEPWDKNETKQCEVDSEHPARDLPEMIKS
jgi:hypothetical protein